MKKERKGLEPYPYLGETFFQKVCGVFFLAVIYLVGQVMRLYSFAKKIYGKIVTWFLFGSK